MPIQWSSQYEVGDPRTDSQHKNLFDYVNRIEKLIEQGKARQLDRQEVEHLFVFLDAYVIPDSVSSSPNGDELTRPKGVL
jgi:hemerythrin